MTAAEVVDTDSDLVPIPVPTKKTKKRPATKHVELPKPEDVAAEANSPYPKGVNVWAYQPEDEKASPILLPLNGFQSGDKLWFFDLAQLPILNQTWRWMDRANVPKPIQRQAQVLSDKEYFAMFNKWFDLMKAAQAPKGSLTAGK